MQVDKNNWNLTSVTPPDEIVQVMFDSGDISNAKPTFYNYKFEYGVDGNPWSKTVVKCPKFWDGNWLVLCENLEVPKGKIIKWKLLNNVN